jgi:hypothetical protein
MAAARFGRRPSPRHSLEAHFLLGSDWGNLCRTSARTTFSTDDSLSTDNHLFTKDS